MSRPPKAERTVPVHVYLPQTLHTRLSLVLFSTAEGRVPHGAWSSFFTTLAEQALERLGSPPSQS